MDNEPPPLCIFEVDEMGNKEFHAMTYSSSFKDYTVFERACIKKGMWWVTRVAVKT